MSSKPKILIVDDTPANLVALEAVLSEVKAEVIKAISGKEALARTLHHNFAIILLDVQMPEMSGFEVANLLHGEEETQHIPIIFLTAAYKDEQHRIEGYDAGAVDYIEKPLNEKILLSKIYFFLQLHNHKEELKALLISKEKSNIRLRTEVSQRLDAEQQLKKLTTVVENSPTVVIISNTDGCIEYVNNAFEKASGYTAEEIKGKSSSVLQSEKTPAGRYKELWDTITAGGIWRGELQNKTRLGDLHWVYATVFPILDTDGKCKHFVSMEEDITLRKEYEERLLHQTNYDDITNLPNRLLALDRLNLALANATRTSSIQYLFYIDLDDFKKVNESIGYETGDRVISECAERFLALVRRGDTVARLGGDEFLIVLSDDGRTANPEIVAEKILNSLKKSFDIDGHNIFLTASIGITEFPDKNSSTQELIQNAEAAMYNAKEAGGNRYLFFTPSMNEKVARRMVLNNKLRRALDKNELSLVFQPQIDLASNKVIGAEALLRWNNTELGDVSPDEFIPIAESSGQIHEIGLWVMEQTIKQTSYWSKHCNSPLKISFNVSSKQLERKSFIENLTKALDTYNCDPKLLDIEITENTLIENTVKAQEILNIIKNIGIGISIDDFGTGYSSLSYLTRFPISILKIDRSFVIDVHKGDQEAALCHGIIGLAHGLGHTVIAEGVENEQQLAFMKDNNCDIIQGYYFSKPLTIQNFNKYLKDKGMM